MKVRWKPDRYFFLGMVGAVLIGVAVAHHLGWYRGGTGSHVNPATVWSEVQSSELSLVDRQFIGSRFRDRTA